MITYRTPFTYADSGIYIEANSEEQAEELFLKTVSKMNYFEQKGFVPKIIKIENVDN